MLCTIVLDSCDIGNDLLALRRELAWEGHRVDDAFHATTDLQAVRDRVFGLIIPADFRIDVTILEKSKAQPQTRPTPMRFYQYGWLYHFQYVGPRIVRNNDELLLTASAIGTKRQRGAFRATVHDVGHQVLKTTPWALHFCAAASDPCLQIADYCAWAVQRKWEMNDTKSYDLISDKIRSEYDLWATGTVHYY